nr:helix-turn-helix domain-containing protein [Fictibacillus nanhaiensis]
MGYSKEFKYNVLLTYEHGNYSVRALCKEFGISKNSLKKWMNQFQKEGLESLRPSGAWKAYSKELKITAVRAYLSGQYSQTELISMYDISSTSVLKKWIKKYNSHKELKDTSLGRTSSMTKGRKTTQDERRQIVLSCLENGKDYQKIAETYKVSYQQVYQWVRKFEKDGDEALKDKRGRTKQENELTPDEAFKLQMKRLERENERLRAENAFLKKLEEIERRQK